LGGGAVRLDDLKVDIPDTMIQDLVNVIRTHYPDTRFFLILGEEYARMDFSSQFAELHFALNNLGVFFNIESSNQERQESIVNLEKHLIKTQLISSKNNAEAIYSTVIEKINKINQTPKEIHKTDSKKAYNKYQVDTLQFFNKADEYIYQREFPKAIQIYKNIIINSMNLFVKSEDSELIPDFQKSSNVNRNQIPSKKVIQQLITFFTTQYDFTKYLLYLIHRRHGRKYVSTIIELRDVLDHISIALTIKKQSIAVRNIKNAEEHVRRAIVESLQRYTREIYDSLLGYLSNNTTSLNGNEITLDIHPRYLSKIMVIQSLFTSARNNKSSSTWKTSVIHFLFALSLCDEIKSEGFTLD